jgi:hypothetical protein
MKTILLLIAVLSLCGFPAYAAETPTQAEIEQALKATFTDKEYATRQYELVVESAQRGAPREGDYRTDGTPANKKTEVIPCKVIWRRITTYTSGDAKVVKERFTGEYVFFQDEFGAWTFKLKKQTSEKF